jgi:glycosyltransferase involved in cell wall biosynthesis
MADAHQPHLEARPGLEARARDRLNGGDIPASAAPDSIVHCSTGRIGGAEASLLEAVAASGGRPLFLLPAEGPLAEAVAARGWEYRIIPWPRGLGSLSARLGNWLALPLVLPGLPGYLRRLRAALESGGDVWSSGVKSHAACLWLAPWLGPRLVFDVRDFLKPFPLRKALAWACLRFGCRVTANSRAVAESYPGARVVYPQVLLARPAMPRRSESGRKIISHLAYFAPYKGQDLFLECARRLVDAGVDADFWIIGDVIYPAPSYARYRERLHAQAAKLGLGSRVRFVGKVDGREAVQDLLERTDLLLHCTRDPEPFGRVVIEGLLCGCETVCHRGSGACEVTAVDRDFPGWLAPLRDILGEDYVRVSLIP